MRTIWMKAIQDRQARVVVGVAVLCLSGWLTGCYTGSPEANPKPSQPTQPVTPTPPPVTPPPPPTVQFMGTVSSGSVPVTGSNVGLFEASATGYGTAATLLASATTDTTGTFQITTAYTCAAGALTYVVATGGDAGQTGTVDNSAIFLVAALGACPGTSTAVNVDEVTTVAAAYALNGFVPAGGAGMTESAEEAAATVAMPGFASSPTNTQGLSDGFANVANVVDNATGVVLTATPGGNGVVPSSTINAVADILQDCVRSTGSTSTACAGLFSAATPPTATSVAAPVNVWQAALDVAAYPGNNVSTLYGLVSATAAYPESLTGAPNDWTVGIAYTSSLLVSGTGLGISAADQVYVTGAGYLLNFSAVGEGGGTNLLASDTNITTTDTLRQVEFDKSGNLFITDGAATGVYEYNPTTTALTLRDYSVSPVLDTDANTYSISLDADGDVWTNSYSKDKCATITCQLVEFVSGTAYTPANTFSGVTVTEPTGAAGGARGMAFDVKTGNIWITAIDDNLAELFTVTPQSAGPATAAGGAIQLTGFGAEVGTPATNTGYGTISVAVDATSQAWFVVAGGAGSTKSKSPTPAAPSALYPVSPTGTVGTAVTGNGLSATGGAGKIVIDGQGTLFVAGGGSAGTSSVTAYVPGQSAFLSPNIGINPGATYTAATSSTPAALSSGLLYEPTYLEVDRSGALWVLSTGDGTSATGPANLVQILGVAKPTDPLLIDGSYGTRP